MTANKSAPEPAPMNRREAMLRILRLGGIGAGVAATGVWLSTRSVHPVEATVLGARRDHTIAANASLPELVVIQNGEPQELVQQALQALGGIGRFISRADVVVVKPNIAWDRVPEQAANTNPAVVAEVVRQCWAAGAQKVIVTDVSCNDPNRCFQRSGIAEAAKRQGAQVLLPDPAQFREADLGGDVLQDWPVFQPFLEADKIINVPIAKHHSLTGATLGMKNWYGILGGQRHRLHQRIHESLADLADFVRPNTHSDGLLSRACPQRPDRRQSRRRSLEEDAGRGNRSGGAGRLRRQSVLEPRCLRSALLANGERTRAGEGGVRKGAEPGRQVGWEVMTLGTRSSR